jgi:hypothetical protein
VYVILRLLGLSCIFVGFGEGVYVTRNVSFGTPEWYAIRLDERATEGSSRHPQDCETSANDDSIFFAAKDVCRVEEERLTEGLEIFD